MQFCDPGNKLTLPRASFKHTCHSLLQKRIAILSVYPCKGIKLAVFRRCLLPLMKNSTQLLPVTRPFNQPLNYIFIKGAIHIKCNLFILQRAVIKTGLYLKAHIFFVERVADITLGLSKKAKHQQFPGYGGSVFFKLPVKVAPIQP